jgi:hypothetical protein
MALLGNVSSGRLKVRSNDAFCPRVFWAADFHNRLRRVEPVCARVFCDLDSAVIGANPNHTGLLG